MHLPPSSNRSRGITEACRRPQGLAIQFSELAWAQELYDDALASVGAEPTQLQIILLERAASMLATGEAGLSSETCGGLGAIWQAAVISRYLLTTVA